MLGKGKWSPVFTLIPFHYKTTSSLTVFGELGAIFLISAICIFIFAKKEEFMNNKLKIPT